MSEQLTLPAEARERAGKGASRALRRDGRVPAVIYGDKKEPLSVHVEEKLLAKMLSTGHFMNTVVMIDAGGKAHRTLPKDVQFHPVSSRPIHVDFLRIGEHSQVHVNVPVRFDQRRGLARHQARRRAQHRPPRPRAGLRRGRDPRRDRHLARPASTSAIRSTFGQVTLPKGTKSAIDDRDFTVATIVAPSAMKAEEGEAAAEAGEVPTVGEEEAEGEGEAQAEGGEEA